MKECVFCRVSNESAKHVKPSLHLEDCIVGPRLRTAATVRQLVPASTCMARACCSLEGWQPCLVLQAGCWRGWSSEQAVAGAACIVRKRSAAPGLPRHIAAWALDWHAAVQTALAPTDLAAATVLAPPTPAAARKRAGLQLIASHVLQGWRSGQWSNSFQQHPAHRITVTQLSPCAGKSGRQAGAKEARSSKWQVLLPGAAEGCVA